MASFPESNPAEPSRPKAKLQTLGFEIFVAVLLQWTVVPVLFADEQGEPASFVNDVIPLLTKSGCNSGVCHAKAGNGQNGFRLSLLGFEPKEDFEYMVKDSRGRRVSLADPESSLLLVKATAKVSHGGGARFQESSAEYAVLHDWIRNGARYDVDSAPKLLSLDVQPNRATLKPGTQQQLKVIAMYSNQSQRDITKTALFETNDNAMAEVTANGLVTVLDLPGKVAVMVRYQGMVSVFNASVPLGAAIDSLPPSKNFVDDAVFANLKELGVPPSPLCDDTTFLRRVSLDIAGRLPTDDERTRFFASQESNKRELAIDRLLRSSEYADFFANKWTAMLKNRRDDASDITSNFAFHAWVRDSLLANKPYDQMVRELLAATGTVIANPPVVWYKRVKEPKQQVEDVAQLFLGVRMQCAQCHHHPFERWSQDDYYSFSAFFTQVGRKPTATRGEDMIFHKRGMAVATNVKSGNVLKPAALGDAIPAIAADEDPRLKLADWMSTPNNPFFAKAVVNRYWKHFLRRGLVEPEDDIRDTNPPSNPELLAALEKHFVASGFDLKSLIRVITSSNAYQLSSSPNQYNIADQQNYSRYYPRRMQAEVFLDAIDDLAGSRTEFPNLPSGTRAIALPDNSYNNASPFLKVFGRPENESVCECERIQSSSLAQSLHLINAKDVKSKLATGNGRADRLSKSDKSTEENVRELYMVAFSREPRSEELKTSIEFLAEPRVDAAGNAIDPQKAKQESLQDLIWALINTKEFLFNH
ncbi:MAG: DUF1553 domain-containing protein [Planctomycetota bacterium]|nr:DUF1553 domain-containing protein [Planctomycetota bacterium]